MKTELAKLQLYKDQLQLLRDDLTVIPLEVYSPGWAKKQHRMNQLSEFLARNDCTKTVAKDSCYTSTRLILVATTKELDQSADTINALRSTIDQLIANLNKVIEEFNKVDTGTKKK